MIQSFLKVSALQIAMALLCLLLFNPAFARDGDQTHTMNSPEGTAARVCEEGCYEKSAQPDRHANTTASKETPSAARERRVAELLRGDQSTTPTPKEGQKKAQ